MGKKSFSITDILNEASKREAAGNTTEYEEVWLSPYEVKEAPENTHQECKNIEELADSFLTVGQEQPTILGRVNGEYRIVDGHRRNLANILNLKRGHKEFEKVKYRYKDMTEAMYELSLLAGNGYTQELTPYEKTRLVERMKQALIKAKEEDGLEIQGKMRDLIAGAIGESSTNVARMESINNNATEEIKEQMKTGSIGITAAYEAAKLPEEEQNEIAEAAAAGKDIRAKEIAQKVAEQTAEEKEREAVKAKEEAEKQEEKGEQAREKQRIAEEEAKRAKILQKYIENGMVHATKRAADAMLKVSESDTPKENWSNTEWVVYFAREIIKQADCVTEEEARTLHDIMVDCQEEKNE